MLIIRRRQGESILIGDDIEIEIVEMGPARVKVGINAPRHISVQRKEIAAVRERNLAAAALGVEVRALIARRLCPENFPKTFPADTDKAFEARYTGHPEPRRTRARHDAGMYP
jgi:carbon storage regulator